MAMLVSPAPGGWRNLPFGATSPAPYSQSRPHQGQDWGYYYARYESRAVVAAASGTVVSVTRDGSWNAGWGNRVVIRVHSSEQITISVNHLANGTIPEWIRHGAWVNAGDMLGVMGTTGETYGEIHLHEELYINGVRVDPEYYRTHHLPGTGSTAGGGGTPLPDPTPIHDYREDTLMNFIYVDDDGNGKPFWTVVNTQNGKFFPPAYDQGTANGWATFWGEARKVTRQEFLNGIQIIKTLA